MTFDASANTRLLCSLVALTIINPTDPLDSSKLKATGDTYFEPSNILNNLAMYFMVGFVGTLISLLIMFIPYPIL